MLIAILIALGVSAGGILLLLIGLMVVKRVKTIKHPAVFKARVRITDGQFPGLKEAWKPCYAAWVTTVLTPRKGLPLNIADVLPAAVPRDGVRDAVGSTGRDGAPRSRSATPLTPLVACASGRVFGFIPSACRPRGGLAAPRSARDECDPWRRRRR